MSVDIRLPQINGVSEKEQLNQVKSYLYQLATQLQWALKNVDTTRESVIIQQMPKSLAPSGTSTQMDAQATFSSIKGLIIKSAEIVEAYYDEISRKLEGVYVAQSDFGDYAEKTTQQIEENSASTTQKFENIQVIITNHDESIETIGVDLSYVQNSIVSIGGDIEALDGRIDETNGSVASLGAGVNDANSKISDVDEDLQGTKESINESIQSVQDNVTGVNALLEDAKAQLQGSLDDLQVYVTGLQDIIIGVTAYLKSGLLYYTEAGIPVYGLEIGQSVRDDVAGTTVFNKYARFTSEKLSFYDSNGIEVAYISDKKLFIRMAEITVSFQIGGLIDLVMPTGDVVTKWVGG